MCGIGTVSARTPPVRFHTAVYQTGLSLRRAPGREQSWAEWPRVFGKEEEECQQAAGSSEHSEAQSLQLTLAP